MVNKQFLDEAHVHGHPFWGIVTPSGKIVTSTSKFEYARAESHPELYSAIKTNDIHGLNPGAFSAALFKNNGGWIRWYVDRRGEFLIQTATPTVNNIQKLSIGIQKLLAYMPADKYVKISWDFANTSDFRQAFAGIDARAFDNTQAVTLLNIISQMSAMADTVSNF